MTMPLNVLEVPAYVAEAKLRAYRQAFRETRRVEDRQIARGFAEIKRGRQVITLSDTIRAGGLDDAGRPRLAVVRATARACFLTLWDEAVAFADVTWATWRQRASVAPLSRSTASLSFPFPGVKALGRQFEAIVPLIPPEHRPRYGRGLADLAGFHLLWEAEWSKSPPRDPALIRHLHGDLWAVHAVWDLTDLERAVLVGRS